MARKSYVVWFTEGVDDDLIAWVNTLPKGRKQPTIKAAIRFYIAFQSSFENLGRLVDELRRLRAAVDAMPENVKRAIGDRLIAADAAPPTVEAGPKIDEETREKRRRNVSKSEW